MLMFGRRQRTKLPCLPASYDPIDIVTAFKGRERQKHQSKAYYDSNSRSLKPLTINQKVLVQNPNNNRWDSYAKIIDIRDSGRSYKIEFANGKISLRNRRFLRPDLSIDKNKITPSRDNDKTITPCLRRSDRLKDKSKKNKNVTFNI